MLTSPDLPVFFFLVNRSLNVLLFVFCFCFFFANNLPSTRASKKLANHAANIESVSYTFCVFFCYFLRLNYNLLIIIYIQQLVCLFRRHLFFWKMGYSLLCYKTVLPFPTSARFSTFAGVKSALHRRLPQNFLGNLSSFTHCCWMALTFGFRSQL